MPELTDQELREIRERAERATPGPWAIEEVEQGDCDAGPDGRPVSWFEGYEPEPSVITQPHSEDGSFFEVADCRTYGRGSGADMANAAFIAHARADVPRLLAEIERLRTGRDSAKKLAMQAMRYLTRDQIVEACSAAGVQVTMCGAPIDNHPAALAADDREG